ncbi:ATP-binding protein [Deinococcus radiopugnans]|uniref:ATP-binding protein n=1 Tax=Deinococcus radiopugnans TaxID=57497 RepID=UPI0035D43AFE
MGPGIATESRARVFEQFSFLVGGTPGFVLGLTIVNSLVKRHGGRGEGTNAAQDGARFQVSLPRVLTTQLRRNFTET